MFEEVNFGPGWEKLGLESGKGVPVPPGESPNGTVDSSKFSMAEDVTSMHCCFAPQEICRVNV